MYAFTQQAEQAQVKLVEAVCETISKAGEVNSRTSEYTLKDLRALADEAMRHIKNIRGAQNISR